MAGKTHVDDSVIERRLRPIYEWLDTGTNKKAVQEADKVLRKQPSLHCARVLKGLALLRMGRRSECQDLVATVVKEGPTDEATLQALTICYREMHMPEEICRVYEAAVRCEPGNEELLSHLFMAYVRVGDYRSQQQTAMRLYKLRPKNPYYFWAVMSHVMQGHKSADPKGKEVSLLLAERMVNNFIKNGKIEAEAEVMTYLHILETQEKYKEAIAVLDGPLAAKVIQQPENFLALKRGSYHSRLGQWGAAAGVYRTLITQESDNWQHYVEYINSAIHLAETAEAEGGGGGGGGGDTPAQDPLRTASDFLAGVRQGAIESNSRERGPLLGPLQLARALEDSGRGERIPELCGDIVELLVLYIERYGDKMCCHGDIVNFLPLVPEDKVPQLLSRVRQLCTLDASGVPVDVEAVYRDLCFHQLRRAVGGQEKLSSVQHVAFADSLVQLYHATQPLSAHVADTDIRPGDAYLILATHSYLTAITSTISAAPPAPPATPTGHSGAGEGQGDGAGQCVDPQSLILRVAAVLEGGIEKTKANFQLKLLLIKVYNMLGATGAARGVYERCDMKHIQLDTLGHVLGMQALDTGSYAAAAAVFAATLKFFMANYKDTSDPLISSYKYGSLTRIPEFVKFRERLAHSLHFASTTAEQMLMELTTEVASHGQLSEVIRQLDINPVTDATDWAALRDNRDLRVMNTWEPLHRHLKEEDITASVAADIALLRVRNLTLRLLGGACALCQTSPPNNNIKENKENSECVNGESGGGGGGGGGGEAGVFEELTDRLTKEAQVLSATYGNASPPQLPLQGPDPPRVYLYAGGAYMNLLVQHAHVLQRVHRYTRDPSDSNTRASGETLKQTRETTDSAFKHHQLVIQEIQTPPNAMPNVNTRALAKLHHLAQSIGVACVFLGCCVCLLRPLKQQASKRSKKRKEAVAMPEVVTEVSAYLSVLTTHLQKLEKVLHDKHKEITTTTTTTTATTAATTAATTTAATATDSSSSSTTSSTSSSSSSSSLVSEEEVRAVCERVRESLAQSLERVTLSIGCKVKYLTSLKL